MTAVEPLLPGITVELLHGLFEGSHPKGPFQTGLTLVEQVEAREDGRRAVVDQTFHVGKPLDGQAWCIAGAT